MTALIYKEVFFEATHRLLHYRGKCSRLHGHQWRVEVWIKGEINNKTGIVVDFNCIKNIINKFDHQVILSEDDPLAGCIRRYQDVITTPRDPTSEHLAELITDMINNECREHSAGARVARIRVWESTGCYAEMNYENN